MGPSAATQETQASDPIARRGARRRHVPFNTRRRLIVAFSTVLAAVLTAFALQIDSLRQMEATFAEMEGHEEEMRLALELEDAVRDQYLHEARYLAGDAAQLGAYETARARALALLSELSARVDEPDTIARVTDVRDAIVELDRLFRVQVAAARGDHAPETLDRSYRLLLLIEGNVNSVFRTLQHAISAVRQDLVDLEKTAVRWTATLLVVTTLLVAAAVLYLSRSVARPLARLSEGAASLAAGDLDARIEIDTPDEFGALASELNAMTVALKHHQERLVESEKLAGVGRLAAGVAHELNNPLQVMLAYLSLDRDVARGRLAGHLAAIEEEVLRCKGIVQGLLDLSRPAMTPSPVDLRELCDDVLGGLRAAGEADAPRLTVAGAGLAIGDGVKLRQVLFNLMKNAVEAAGPEGDVQVAVAASEGGVRVTVRDSGPGISPDAKAQLFEPFFTTKPEGTGLGLAVSRAIALAHGGDIEVGNASAGGAVFTLRLPAAQGRQ